LEGNYESDQINIEDMHIELVEHYDDYTLIERKITLTQTTIHTKRRKLNLSVSEIVKLLIRSIRDYVG